MCGGSTSTSSPDGQPVRVTAADASGRSTSEAHAASDALAATVAKGSASIAHQPLASGSELVQAGALVVDPVTGQPAGVVVASDQLTGKLTIESQRIIAAYENYSRLRFLTRPLQGMYLSLFLMMTLMILVSATWMGLYLAKRITRPVQMLAAGGARDWRRTSRSPHRAGDARRVRLAHRGLQLDGGGARDQPEHAGARRTCSSRTAAAISKRFWSASPRVWSRSAPTSASKRSTARPAGCWPSIARSSARRPIGCSRATISTRCARCCTRRTRRARHAAAHEITLARDGRELHLAAAATPLQGEEGVASGAVLVFDDVTPLIRTQKVAAWRDVARRLAHEIKNPLTPIQLCAERMQRHFGTAPAPARELVDECTATIVAEVESLKGLVDEFAQFARMPAPKAVPEDLHKMLAEALALYNGLFRDDPDRAAVRRDAAAGADRRRADPARGHQPRRQRGRGARRRRRGGARPTARRRPSSSRRSTIARSAWRGSSSPTTVRASRRPIATSCSCRTTRPSSAAAVSAWPSSGASSSSTAAASKWRTTTHGHAIHRRAAVVRSAAA